MSGSEKRMGRASKAVLVLDDGRTFTGTTFGAVGQTLGEAVFSTGMSGYQETLTDPSYHGQIVVATAPQIGNTGWNDEDGESRGDKIWVAGYAVRDPSPRASNWRATGTLDDELVRQGIVGIAGIDTRAVVRHLRSAGSMKAGVFSGPALAEVDELLNRVRSQPSMLGADLAGEVSTPSPYVVEPEGTARFTVAALDLGIKTNTPRNFAARIARSGRAGPVHLSLPFDLLEAHLDDLDACLPAVGAGDAVVVPLTLEAGASVVSHLAAAARPLVLCGPGQSGAAARAALRRLEAHLGVPVLVMESPRGVNDPSLGAFAEVLADADTIVLLGKTLDFTLKFGRAPHVDAGAGFVVVDADRTSVDRIARLGASRLRFATVADPADAVRALLADGAARGIGHVAWRERVAVAVAHRPAAWRTLRDSTETPVHPLALCAALQRFTDAHPESLLVCDGGEIGQWPQAAVDAPQRLINGVAGAIGHAVPYAIAACAWRQRDGATSPAPVVAVMGDGSAGFHIAEFDTAVREGLPVIVVVGNDARWNAEHQIQLRDYGADRAAHCDLLPTRYDRVAEAFGAHAEFVDTPSELDAALDRAWRSGRPACINVTIASVPAPVVRRAPTR